MKKLLIGSILVMGVIALNFKGIILGAMDLVDYVGEKTNTNVVTTIDRLNTLYYTFYEN
ncbi:hypothetical protein [Peptostreptococcus porci]|uniref:hypothetical protein n=1 Tax=Peptostreptococcus porci TaxID=2652282 RepID=UPI002A83E464|nr:hypothetical protein [Peptostreptococcus porci]MDY4127612.1 hypothetical protein [Peptostreptococcus porci]